MQARKRRRHKPKSLGETFSYVAYDLLLALAGGVIGAVTVIYYERMIPPPNSSFIEIRLFLTLALVVVIFIVILLPLRRRLDERG